MNKNECKKYIRKTFNNLLKQRKEITMQNLEIQMKKEINNEMKLYLAYGKIAIHNINLSANKITIKEMMAQIDTISSLYSQSEAIKKAETL